MTTTTIGLCNGFAEVHRMIRTLVTQGIPREAITVVANCEETAVSDVIAAMAWGAEVDVGPASRGEPAAFIALGIPADEVPAYAMVLDGGGALVSVGAAEDQMDQVLALMERSTAEAGATQTAP